MLVRSFEDVEAQQPSGEMRDVSVRWLIGEADGAPHFAMRRFELAPGGFTPQHQHAWEHEVYVLAGRGTLAGAESEQDLVPGQAVYVAPEEQHQFRAADDEPLVFLCMVPNHSY